jgi:hypothetical protein
VQYTLEPLVFVGPAEGLPKEQWKLRSAKELLDLKICDMACGSGAFLVQACRYLAARLMEAWDESERSAQAGHQDTLFDKKAKTPTVIRITPYGMSSRGGLYEQLVPLDPDERQTYALRIVAQRCLYGVDKNPLAAEMAKLSLWLLTLAKDKPFEFLDHAIRCGDSLVGIHNLDQLRKFNLDGKGEDNTLFLQFLDPRIKEAIEIRRKLETMQANSVEDVQAQEQLLLEANEKLERLKCAADMLVGAEFLRWDQHDLIEDELRDEERDDEDQARPGPSWLKAKKATERFRRAARTHTAIETAVHFSDSDLDTFRYTCQTWLNGQPTFHLPLEFPEVVADRGGFDAFVGNPPFIGGTLISGRLGKEFHAYVTGELAGDSESGGRADLCCYFFRRIATLLRNPGCLGLLATNTIAQGDTREVGLDYLLNNGLTLYRATPSRKWPGAAHLEIAELWGRHGDWQAGCHLDGQDVEHISALLTDQLATFGPPKALVANQAFACEGSKPLGMGFVLTPEEGQMLIKKNKKNAQVLFPFLNGMDLNSRFDQSPSRWVIDFRDMPLDKDNCPEGYTGRVAADFAECLEIIREKVFPERTRKAPSGAFVLRKPLPNKWWQHAEKRTALYSRIKGMSRVLIRSRVSNLNCISFVPTGWVYSEATVVFATDKIAHFVVLQSCFHTEWIYQYASSMRTDVRYTPSDCLDTFPFPPLSQMEAVGEKYHHHRTALMLDSHEGLTKTYNRFHDPDETSENIQKLRQLHAELDNAVAAAYGWTDLDLGHGFHETKQGTRYTISEPARREVLARLLKLNHERYAEEVAKGLHDKKKAKGAKKRKAVDDSGNSLF